MHSYRMTSRVMVGTLAALTTLLSAALAATIDTVPVGNADNAPDQNFNLQGQFGAVAYDYRIGKYEVTNSQYIEFLNAKDPTGANSLELYSSSMTSDARGGINFTAANANGSKYIVKTGRNNNPVVYVNWYDCIRFANWLHNGPGTSDTETGAYTLLGGTPTPSNGDGISRNPGATWFLPSENEWYKAAYHQPVTQGGDSDNYWLYPTQMNSTPYADQPPGSGAPPQSNTANFFQDDGIANGYDDGFAVTGSTSISNSQNYLTDAGAYIQSSSFYGTFDQGGNVEEWTEALIDSSSRVVRGGMWSHPSGYLQSRGRLRNRPTTEIEIAGFRVATLPAIVPEPSSLTLLATGAIGLLLWTRRRRAV